MPKGQPATTQNKANVVKISAEIGEETKYNLSLVQGKLVKEFGRIPSQGETLDFLTDFYMKHNE